MAELAGTPKEFHKFIGPRVRNAIQALTKKRKRELGFICQFCNKKAELEAAHIKGNGRKEIIEKILQKYAIHSSEAITKIDLDKVEKEIIAAHKPIDKYFKFLCSSCHVKYDSN